MENKILATVNGMDITSDVLDRTIEQLPPERKAYFQSEFGRKQLLEQLVSVELINAFGLEIGVDKDQMYLTQMEQVEKEIRFNSTMNKIMSEINVDDAEAEIAFKQNPGKYGGQQSVRASHILVDNEELANDILKKIVEDGMDFGDAAQEFSSCPSKAQGGDLGDFGRGMMVPEFENAAFALEKGEMTKEPVKTQFGYHIIKTTDKKGFGTANFDDVKETIRTELLKEKQMDHYTKLLEDLKSKYNVTLK